MTKNIGRDLRLVAAEYPAAAEQGLVHGAEDRHHDHGIGDADQATAKQQGQHPGAPGGGQGARHDLRRFEPKCFDQMAQQESTDEAVMGRIEQRRIRRCDQRGHGLCGEGEIILLVGGQDAIGRHHQQDEDQEDDEIDPRAVECPGPAADRGHPRDEPDEVARRHRGDSLALGMCGARSARKAHHYRHMIGA